MDDVDNMGENVDCELASCNIVQKWQGLSSYSPKHLKYKRIQLWDQYGTISGSFYYT